MSKLEQLEKSKFRNSFHLKEKERQIVLDKGIDIIRQHAYEIIIKRLKPKYIKNDGKQTPTKNHPVFVAQHATATCCRDCLYKWHHIEKNKELSDSEVDYIVEIIVEWIKKNM